MAPESAPEPGLRERPSIPAPRPGLPLGRFFLPAKTLKPERRPPSPLYLGEKSSLLCIYSLCLYILRK